MDASSVFPSFSLDQLTAFIAAVEAGSFSGAARRLGRAQSAVSYAIGQLESGLGSVLFDRSGHTPVLTDAGRGLATEARLVLAQARDLSERAAHLRDGLESELRVVVDAIFPQELLLATCADFQEQFPSTSLRIESALLLEAVTIVKDGTADLGVCNLAGGEEPHLHLAHLGTVQLLPVCAPGHPLAALPRPQRQSALRQSTQIVHSERRQALTRDQGVIGARAWRVTDLELKRELILRGVGWGSLPSALAAPLLEEGRLVLLEPEPWPSGHRIAFHAVTRREHPLGRAGQWFRDRLALSS